MVDEYTLRTPSFRHKIARTVLDTPIRCAFISTAKATEGHIKLDTLAARYNISIAQAKRILKEGLPRSKKRSKKASRQTIITREDVLRIEKTIDSS